LKLGAWLMENGRCEFTLWAPCCDDVELKLVGPGQYVSMQRDEKAYWKVEVPDISPGDRYLYRLDGKEERPDPASHHQPDGVNSPSAVFDHASHQWGDSEWKGMDISDMIMYEAHIGTFTPEGTFETALSKLDHLIDLGVNTMSIMPVSQFPGDRNWGYDGVHHFAPQNTYGGPDGLKLLVDEAHKKGMAVVLDVVYNHLGPEGNYTQELGPYFTDRVKTPWGSAINFDGPWSDEVRNFFIMNALYWYEVFHVDGLRLDAIHGIYDMSARPFLKELSEAVEELSKETGRKLLLIPESDLNDSRVIRPPKEGGYGHHGQWSDDFHHAVHAALTGERHGYYLDFGEVPLVTKAINDGYVYDGRYSRFRRRTHGNRAADLSGHKFVVCSQNHDQVGNRMLGERLVTLVGFEAAKLAAFSVITSPYVPLLFMGEEFGEAAPFLYFISHYDEALVEAVREGRKAEFDSFDWEGEPPDPADPETFHQCKLNWSLLDGEKGRMMLGLYSRLISLRKELPPLADLSREHVRAETGADDIVVVMHRAHGLSGAYVVMNFSGDEATFGAGLGAGNWKKAFDTAEEEWMGPGSLLPLVIKDGQDLTLRPYQGALYKKE